MKFMKMKDAIKYSKDKDDTCIHTPTKKIFKELKQYLFSKGYRYSDHTKDWFYGINTVVEIYSASQTIEIKSMKYAHDNKMIIIELEIDSNLEEQTEIEDTEYIHVKKVKHVDIPKQPCKLEFTRKIIKVNKKKNRTLFGW